MQMEKMIDVISQDRCNRKRNGQWFKNLNQISGKELTCWSTDSRGVPRSFTSLSSPGPPAFSDKRFKFFFLCRFHSLNERSLFALPRQVYLCCFLLLLDVRHRHIYAKRQMPKRNPLRCRRVGVVFAGGQNHFLTKPFLQGVGAGTLVLQVDSVALEDTGMPSIGLWGVVP